MTVMNVTAKRYTATGACGIGRARLAAVQVTTTAGARLTINEGSNVKLDLDFVTGDTFHISIPGDGILFNADPTIATLTGISAVTLFFM